MNDKKRIPETDSQFVLSYELLSLLRWLVEHGQEDLESIVHKAINSGLDKELKKKKFTQNQEDTLEEMQHGIVDFFTTMEVFMLEAMHTQLKKRARAQNLQPTVDHIDMNAYDTATVETSLENATNQLERTPNANPKELLFKELLRRWRPTKKNSTN